MFVSMLVRLSFSVLCSKSSFVLSNRQRGPVSGVFRLSGLSVKFGWGSDHCPCDHQQR